jgi:hypothetical protein
MKNFWNVITSISFAKFFVSVGIAGSDFIERNCSVLWENGTRDGNHEQEETISLDKIRTSDADAYKELCERYGSDNIPEVLHYNKGL